MRCVRTPAAIHLIQHALREDEAGYRKLGYHDIVTEFEIGELVNCTYVCTYVDGFLFLALSFFRSLVMNGNLLWSTRAASPSIRSVRVSF